MFFFNLMVERKSAPYPQYRNPSKPDYPCNVDFTMDEFHKFKQRMCLKLSDSQYKSSITSNNIPQDVTRSKEYPQKLYWNDGTEFQCLYSDSTWRVCSYKDLIRLS